jgi:pyridoxal phosphate enzyme (YggS family)
MLKLPQNLPENIQRVRQRIAGAATRYGRSVDCVTLVAVAKGHPAETLRTAAHAGIEHVGESYLKEAQDKMQALRDLELTWHFIGQVQANKTRPIAAAFAWVHGVDRLRIAQRLSEQRPYHAPPLNVCLQVNVGGEQSKGGVAVAELPALAAQVAALPRLTLRGLMCLPPPETELDRQRHWLAIVRRAFESLNATGARLDTLSMGMSDDLEAAIAEGATMVRVGTALFGPRPEQASLQSRR